MAVYYIREFADYSDADRVLELDQNAYEQMWQWTFASLIYLLFFVFAIIKKDIKEGFGRKHGRIFLILSFILGPFAMLGLSLYTILVSKYEDALLTHEII